MKRITSMKRGEQGVCIVSRDQPKFWLEYSLRKRPAWSNYIGGVSRVLECHVLATMSRLWGGFEHQKDLRTSPVERKGSELCSFWYDSYPEGASHVFWDLDIGMNLDDSALLVSYVVAAWDHIAHTRNSLKNWNRKLIKLFLRFILYRRITPPWLYNAKDTLTQTSMRSNHQRNIVCLPQQSTLSIVFLLLLL